MAQPAGVTIRVSGAGNQGAFVDLVPVGYGPGPLGPRTIELETSADGTVSVGGEGRSQVQPGIYSVWVESGAKDQGGNYTGGETFVYIGKNGMAAVNFDLTGRPPVDPPPETVFQIGLRAKERCQLVTYERAVNQLTAHADDMDRAMRDLQSAIEAYIRDGATDGVPEPQRTRVAGLLLAGGSPKEISQELSNIGKELTPNPLRNLQAAYASLSAMAELKALLLDYVQKLQPPPECQKRTAMLQDSLRPINVGPKGTVGCDAKLKQDVANTLGFGGGGLGALGGGKHSFGIAAVAAGLAAPAAIRRGRTRPRTNPRFRPIRCRRK